VTRLVASSERRLPGKALIALYGALLVGVAAFVEFFMELVGLDQTIRERPDGRDIALMPCAS